MYTRAYLMAVLVSIAMTLKELSDEAHARYPLL
jgi:hypothetical protein